ncbi:MAG: anthrone oxygenase family protein [Acidobacteriota bacterium]
MNVFAIVLVLATLLCALVAGFVFAFACVAMPGLGTLNDREFIRAFQVIDRVIQNNQPFFVLVWAGSALALMASGVMGFGQLEGLDRLLLLGAVVIYIGGVQAPTIAINVPLNNQLQTVGADTADEAVLAKAREAFESPWNRWNVIRTLLATLTSALLMVVLLRL